MVYHKIANNAFLIVTSVINQDVFNVLRLELSLNVNVLMVIMKRVAANNVNLNVKLAKTYNHAQNVKVIELVQIVYAQVTNMMIILMFYAKIVLNIALYVMVSNANNVILIEFMMGRIVFVKKVIMRVMWDVKSVNLVA